MQPLPRSAFFIKAAGPIVLVGLMVIGADAYGTPLAHASHREDEPHVEDQMHDTLGPAHDVPGAPFRCLSQRARLQSDAAVNTVIQAFTLMMQHRGDYPTTILGSTKVSTSTLRARSLSSLASPIRKEKSLPSSSHEPKDPGRVKLLISAAALKEKGYVGEPDRLVPALAREFQ